MLSVIPSHRANGAVKFNCQFSNIPLPSKAVADWIVCGDDMTRDESHMSGFVASLLGFEGVLPSAGQKTKHTIYKIYYLSYKCFSF